ncbi:hypothetical protein ECE50_024765 [Chitinophaga sp. Mgbs1]|uniref:Uncharacterized protein n=1 Tax=Chitinophaga solisilvae TaxID=1233460 RepID=A0A3S1B001_9BACT|nr:hypothetical protein [Chitinophaga solisilvae]
MKTLSFKTIAFVIAAAATFSSCKRSDLELPPPDNSADGKMLAALLGSHAAKTETFSVDAATGGVLTTAKGTKFNIPSHIFVTSGGAPVTGSVTISIREIRDVSSMILTDKPTTTSNGEILISYGEFFVQAQQNNQPVQLRKDSNDGIRVAVPAKPANGAREVPMWSGDTTITYTSNGYNHINQPVSITSQVAAFKGVQWNQISNSFALFNPSTGTMNFRLDSLIRWVNCDALAGDPGPKTTVMAYFTNHFNNETGASYGGEQPSMLFFKPRGRNTLIKFYNVIMQPAAGKEGFHSYQTSIPVGLQGTFLAISAVNGQYYAEQKDVTIAAPAAGDNYSSVSFNLQPVDANGLLGLINSMDGK